MAAPPPPSIPPTMRAWTYNKRGKPAAILQYSTIPTPIPEPHQFLIRVSYTSFNGGSLAIQALLPHFTSAPCIPEMEYSGIVVSIPTSPTAAGHFQVGDRIFGYRGPADLIAAKGTLCEYVVADKSMVTLKPAAWTMAEASGLGPCGVTAVQACRLAGVKTGDKVLITGGSGGLGSIFVQYARVLVGDQGKVVATCSGRNVELVKSLGADEVVDYTKHTDLSAYCAAEHGKGKEFDAIFDIIGDDLLHKRCPDYLKPDGMFVLLGNMKILANISYFAVITMLLCKLETYRPVWLGGIPRPYRMMNAVPTQSDVEILTKLVDEGKKIKVHVDGIWAMEDAMEAYERLSSQRTRGKVVVKVDPEAED